MAKSDPVEIDKDLDAQPLDTEPQPLDADGNPILPPDPAPDAIDGAGNPVPTTDAEPVSQIVPGEDPFKQPETVFANAPAGQTPVDLAAPVQTAPDGEPYNPDANTPESAVDPVRATVEDPSGYSRIGSTLSQDGVAIADPPPTEQALRVLEAMDTPVRVTL